MADLLDHYAVVGNPIEHSQSPRIHAAFAAATGQKLKYDKHLVALGDFDRFVDAFFAGGGCGLNVTLPFKADAARWADHRSPAVEFADAANTLWVDDQGRRHAANTDGIGLVRDIQSNHQVALAGKRVLLLGAGGAAQGVVAPLLDAHISSLTIANRTAATALAVADRAQSALSCEGVSEGASRAAVRGCALTADGIGSELFDVIINATSAGLGGAQLTVPAQVARGGFAYDMVYGPPADPFLNWARAAGADQAVDGLGMLVEQAAAAFEIWRGVLPATDEVLARLRG